MDIRNGVQEHKALASAQDWGFILKKCIYLIIHVVASPILWFLLLSPLLCPACLEWEQATG